MARFLHPIEAFTFRKYSHICLTFSWALGLGVGGLAFRYAGEYLVPLMPLAAAGQLSIVSLFLCTSLPFLFCAFALRFDKPGFLLPVCFFRAFLFSHVVCAVFTAFGSHGWLIRWLLLFTPSFSCCLLYACAGRHISGLRRFSGTELIFYLLCITALVSADYFCISPFLRQLLS